MFITNVYIDALFFVVILHWKNSEHQYVHTRHSIGWWRWWCVVYLYHAHPPSWPKSKQNTSRTLGRNEQTATMQVLQEKHFFHNKSLSILRWFLRSIASWFLNFTGYTACRFWFFFRSCAVINVSATGLVQLQQLLGKESLSSCYRA